MYALDLLYVLILKVSKWTEADSRRVKKTGNSAMAERVFKKEMWSVHTGNIYWKRKVSTVVSSLGTMVRVQTCLHTGSNWRQSSGGAWIIPTHRECFFTLRLEEYTIIRYFHVQPENKEKWGQAHASASSIRTARSLSSCQQTNDGK